MVYSYMTAKKKLQGDTSRRHSTCRRHKPLLLNDKAGIHTQNNIESHRERDIFRVQGEGGGWRYKEKEA